MTDDELTITWTALDPTASERRRISARLAAYLEAHDTSLAAEWLALFRVSPFTAIALATASAVAIAALPLAWFASALM
jgi:hypothetical protein